MATNFNKNAINIGGGIKPVTTNTPGDVRTRIETISEVNSIPLPYVGMIFFVMDEQKFYKVLSLKGKIVAGIEVPNMIIDTFEELIEKQDLSHLASKEEIAELIDEAPEEMNTLGELAQAIKFLQETIESLPKVDFNDKGELIVTIGGSTRTFVPKGAEVELDEATDKMIIEGVEISYLEENEKIEIDETFLNYEDEKENLDIREENE